MCFALSVSFASFAFLLPVHLTAQGGPGVITTFAGTGEIGFSGDGGPAAQAQLNRPFGVAVDEKGDVYIADLSNHRVRRVGADGIITTLAGTGTEGFSGDGGPAAQAQLSRPFGMAVDGRGNLYIADAGNNRIRRVGPDGIITTLAGTGEAGFSGDGGPSAQARLSNPRSVAVDARGNVYIADLSNNRIRRVGPDGMITTFAGTGAPGFSGDRGPAAGAQLNSPTSVAVDAKGDVYIVDQGNHRVRRVGPDGIITTFAGTGMRGFSGDGGPVAGAQLNFPTGVAVDARGNVYIADTDNRRVRRVEGDGFITTFAGTGEAGFSGDGGPAAQAQLSRPFDVAADGRGNLYIADAGNNRIRRVSFTEIDGPSIRLWTSSLAFDSTWVKDSSLKEFTISNPGAEGLSIHSVTVIGPDASQFSVSPTTATIAAKQTLTVRVTFAPTSSGLKSASLSVIHSAAGNPDTVALSGVGRPPIRLWTSSLAFGPIEVRDSSLKEFTISNPGAESLSIHSVTVIGPDASQFSVSPTTATIAAKQTLTVRVTFAPTSSGLKSASLSVIHSAAGNPDTVALSGIGLGTVVTPKSPGTITTIAGRGKGEGSEDGGLALDAQLSSPSGVAVDGKGNVYMAEGNRIRRVGSDGIITTVAGTGTVGFSGDGGLATQARLNLPGGIAVDAKGDVYIADTYNHRIRRVGPDGIITTFAGSGSTGEFVEGFSGDGGPATQARLSWPVDVAVDGKGNVYIADWRNSRVRRVGPDGIITTFAGTGTYGFSGDGGPATQAQLPFSSGVAVDTRGNVYIVVSDNGNTRRVGPDGIIQTLVEDKGSNLGSSNVVLGVVVDEKGNVYIADRVNHRIRRVGPDGVITTVAGTGKGGFSGDGGPALQAQLRSPSGVAVDEKGNVYIADRSNHRIRRVGPDGVITTFAGMEPEPPDFSGDGGPAIHAQLDSAVGVAVDARGTVYIVERGTFRAFSFEERSRGGIFITPSGRWENFRVRRVGSGGIIRTLQGSKWVYGDYLGRPISELIKPAGVAVDAQGNLYIAGVRVVFNTAYNIVRRIGPDGTITTVAGTGTKGSLGDGGPAAQAQLNDPHGVAVDAKGNLYIADTGNHRIRRVGPDGIITTFAGRVAAGFSGDGGPAVQAQLNGPTGVAVDAQGTLYIADTGNHRIRRVGPDGIITTFAGTGTPGFSGDGGPAAQAQLSRSSGVAVDARGNVYIADTGNHRIRRVGPDGIITTFAGTGAPGFSGDEGPAAQASLNGPEGVAVDARGNVYIADTGNRRIRRVEGEIREIASGRSADFDGNGAVNFDDFFLFASAFGQKAAGGDARFDLDGDGEVDFDDFFAFAADFGKKSR